jgi:hypothetical protein
MPGKDLHLPDGVRSGAHHVGRQSRPRETAAKRRRATRWCLAACAPDLSVSVSPWPKPVDAIAA